MTPKNRPGGEVTTPYPIEYVKGYQRVERLRIVSNIKGLLTRRFN
jgi:hypothetical protein